MSFTQFIRIWILICGLAYAVLGLVNLGYAIYARGVREHLYAIQFRERALIGLAYATLCVVAVLFGGMFI